MGIFSEGDRRTLWLRVTLLNACFFGMVACAPLWTNVHTFPLLPIIHGFPILPPPWDKILFGAMLLSLVAAAWFYRPAIKFFLLASLFAYCEDENRGQPWLYMYWVMLLLTLLSGKTAVAACRLAMSAVYIWSGIQKCNARFFKVGVLNFIEPANHWHLPLFALDLLRWAVDCAPFIEIGIGLALWSPRSRRVAIGAAVILHAGALLFLGPLGSNYNAVVWPWNLAMPTLIWVLFAKGSYWEKRSDEPAESAAKPDKAAPSSAKAKAPGREEKKGAIAKSAIGLKETFAVVQRSKPAFAIVLLYSLLPVLGFFGLWDSYFSFSLYSENSATANIFITQAFADRLPERMKKQVQKFSDRFDPRHQGPLMFNYGGWGYAELRVPPIAEPRNFVSVFNALQTWSNEPGDLRMIVGQKAGPVIFYQGKMREYLTPQ